MEPVKIGETMRAGALGRVIQVGEGTKFVPGDLVNGTMGMCFGFGLWSGGGCVLNWFVRLDGVYYCAFERVPEDCVSVVLRAQAYGDIERRGSLFSIPTGAELIDFLGPLGMNGLTAYFVRSSLP